MRKHRKYAPFVKVGKRWYRAGYSKPCEYPHNTGMEQKILYNALPKEQAIKVYQNWLLAPFLNGIDEIRELRVVKD